MRCGLYSNTAAKKGLLSGSHQLISKGIVCYFPDGFQSPLFERNSDHNKKN
jgi:hypothetical protein